MKRVVEFLAISVVALFLIVALPSEVTGTASRDYVVAEGVGDTGAVNLVTAIYLGYRVFDTFGETVVLLLAVSGVTFLAARFRP